MKQVFADRDALHEERQYVEYFANRGVPVATALQVKVVMQEELGVDLSCLRPSDDFSQNLRPLLNWDSMADVAIIEGLEKCFHITISDTEAERTKTVAEVVTLIQNKIGNENAI